jgi:type II secretory pathway component GspD/PulD (secretin)
MKFACGILGVALVLIGPVLVGPGAWGQTGESGTTEKGSTASRQDAAANARVDSRPFQTFYLANATQANDANEITVAVRNLLPPDVKVFLVPSQNALTVRGTADELALAQKIISDLDRPKKTYRLTFTISETDGGKRIGVQHFAMIVVAGQRTVMKQGSKVPIATGSYSNTGNTPGAQTQITYIDVGMNFDVTLDELANGAMLRSKVEQLSTAEQTSGVGLQDPIIRQSHLEGTSFLTLGKPLVLGSIDIPGSTRHLDVEVVMEQIAR